MKPEVVSTAASLWDQFKRESLLLLRSTILQSLDSQSRGEASQWYDRACRTTHDLLFDSLLVDLEFVQYSTGLSAFVYGVYTGHPPLTRVPEIHMLKDRLQPGQWALGCGVKNPSELRRVSWNRPEHHIIASPPDVFLRVAAGAVGTLRMMNPEENLRVVVIGSERFCAAMDNVVGGSDLSFHIDEFNIKFFNTPTYLVIENYGNNMVDFAVETSVHVPSVRLLAGIPQDMCTPDFERGVVSPMRTIWKSGDSHSMLKDEKGKHWWPLVPPGGGSV